MRNSGYISVVSHQQLMGVRIVKRSVMVCMVLGVLAVIPVGQLMADVLPSWNKTKNAADDIIYDGHRITLYCGCAYKSDGDSDGSGRPDLMACGFSGPAKHEARAKRTEWEHIVPASLMPARQMACWADPSSIDACQKSNGSFLKGRACCEKSSQEARNMIFDLHNLAPSIGQVNALRLNDHYGEINGENRPFGACAAEDVDGLFEPGDEERGDVARVWLYMNWKHGVVISDDELRMFIRWDRADPVSAWEKLRNQRIITVQGNGNPWIE